MGSGPDQGRGLDVLTNQNGGMEVRSIGVGPKTRFTLKRSKTRKRRWVAMLRVSRLTTRVPHILTLNKPCHVKHGNTVVK